MSRSVRTTALVAHVTASVGWLGAVVVLLVLAIVGVTSDDVQVVHAVYLVAEPITWLVIVPLAVLSLLSGLLQALATPWGLVRHYWVVFKLLLTVVATIILLLYTQTVEMAADAALRPEIQLEDLRSGSLVVHAAGAVLLLLAATALGVFKPRGLTPYGHRRQAQAFGGRA